jgi:hypothetical protein
VFLSDRNVHALAVNADAFLRVFITGRNKLRNYLFLLSIIIFTEN